MSKISVLCTKTVFHSATGQLFTAGNHFNVVPAPDLAEFMAFEPELRAQLRLEWANRHNKIAPNVKVAAEQDAAKLADLAREMAAKAPKPEPKTLHELTAQAQEQRPEPTHAAR